MAATSEGRYGLAMQTSWGDRTEPVIEFGPPGDIDDREIGPVLASGSCQAEATHSARQLDIGQQQGKVGFWLREQRESFAAGLCLGDLETLVHQGLSQRSCG